MAWQAGDEGAVEQDLCGVQVDIVNPWTKDERDIEQANSARDRLGGGANAETYSKC